MQPEAGETAGSRAFSLRSRDPPEIIYSREKSQGRMRSYHLILITTEKTNPEMFTFLGLKVTLRMENNLYLAYLNVN
jgi:hypothetical protein